MVFSSQIFLFYFLPLCLVGYYLLPVRWRNLFLTIASYLFYGWWHQWFVLLMLFSTAVDYYCGKLIALPGASEARRKGGVWLSVLVNLALLGFFKYGVFVQENVQAAIRMFGPEGSGNYELLQIVLPLGISFYTFQSMSYSIDIYRGHAKPAKSLLDFSCYVAMFPQLVAGPIVRYREMADQLNDRPQRGELFAEGVLTFMVGFFKKVVLANTMGQVADLAFGAESLPAHVAWFGLLGYTLQIYYDFSGYSDMAIGLGSLLGFKLPLNFASPYKSRSITEFWQRWHISLSTWLRDYLYISLGGNRKGTKWLYFNLFVTMLLGGFWHGAEWQLIAFGGCHGAMLVLERTAGKKALYEKLSPAWQNIVTMVLFMLTLVFFRATSMSHAMVYFKNLFVSSGDVASGALVAGQAYTPFFLILTVVCVVIARFGREAREVVELAQKSFLVTLCVFTGFILAVVVMFAQAEDPFIYFRF